MRFVSRIDPGLHDGLMHSNKTQRWVHNHFLQGRKVKWGSRTYSIAAGAVPGAFILETFTGGIIPYYIIPLDVPISSNPQTEPWTWQRALRNATPQPKQVTIDNWILTKSGGRTRCVSLGLWADRIPSFDAYPPRVDGSFVIRHLSASGGFVIPLALRRAKFRTWTSGIKCLKIGHFAL